MIFKTESAHGIKCVSGNKISAPDDFEYVPDIMPLYGYRKEFIVLCLLIHSGNPDVHWYWHGLVIEPVDDAFGPYRRAGLVVGRAKSVESMAYPYYDDVSMWENAPLQTITLI